MHNDTAERIADMTARGWWGTATLNTIFAETVARHPDALALVDPPNRAEITDGPIYRLTYAELDALIDRMAANLIRYGVWSNDIIAVQLPNTAELVITILAAARIGAIVSPFPVQYREHEIEQLVNALGARVIITTTRVGKIAHAQMFADLRPRCPSVQAILSWGENLPAGVKRLEGLLVSTGHTLRYEEYRQISANIPDANDILTICWTSGTESQPKGVPRSHNEWLMIGMAMMDAATIDQGAVILNPFPLVNMAGIGGMLMSWMLTGGTFVLHHPMSLPVFLKQIGDEGVTFTVAPPALLNLLLQNPALLAQANLSTIKTMGSGSAPLSPWMVKTWQVDHGIAIVNFFGANEGTTLISGPREIPDPEERAQFFPRFGVPGYDWPARIARMMRTKLVDPQTGALITAPGQPGELLIWGAAIFGGYFQAPELTRRAFDDEGYFRTGDLFAIAGERGEYYQYVGRSKDIIIRGGINISAEEIEGLIQGYPKVAEVAIVGYPDATLGEGACACVVPRPGETVTLEDLVGYLREQRIAPYKLPERILILDALPRNALGKVLKFALRERIQSR